MSATATASATASEVSATADETLDANVASTRFAGAALEARRANYSTRKADPGLAAISAIPNTPPSVGAPPGSFTTMSLESNFLKRA